MKNLLLIAVVLTISGCIGTSMPRETALLSARLGPEIKEAKKSHYEFLFAWDKSEREKVEILLHYFWIPNHIKDFIEEPLFKRVLKSDICKSTAGKMDRALVVQEMVEDLTASIQVQRDLEFGKVADRTAISKDALDGHYAHIESMYHSMNANVQLVQKGLAMEKRIREALEKPINKIVPLHKARTGFDKLFKIGD